MVAVQLVKNFNFSVNLQSAIIANNIYLFGFLENIRLDISCDSSAAKQVIHMKY